MPTVLNAGCGVPRSGDLPAFFAPWRELRVDADPAVSPDLIADITNLSMIPSESVDAIWSAHCVEHLYQHQIGSALSEFHRILRPPGFVCVIVPDLQVAANFITADRMDDAIYESISGQPVTAHDMLFGWGWAIAQGHPRMAHHSGFTPNSMLRHFNSSPFAEVVLRRRPAAVELAAVALKTPSANAAERDALMSDLAL
jgi:hypothetical protein